MEYRLRIATPAYVCQDTVFSQPARLDVVSDFDNDGVLNSVDLDDDNDGILDSIEGEGDLTVTVSRTDSTSTLTVTDATTSRSWIH